MSESQSDPRPATAAPPAPRRSMSLVLILGITIAWAVYLMIWGPRTDGMGDLPAPALAPPVTAARTDFRWTLTDLQGAPVELSDYRGLPIFLNIWATWCGPCVAELPSIEALAANPRLEGVAFLCVAHDDPEAVRAFVAREKLTVPVLIAGDNAPVPEPFATDAIPATFLIDADGRIVASQVGSSQWDDPEVVDLLEKLAGRADVSDE